MMTHLQTGRQTGVLELTELFLECSEVLFNFTHQVDLQTSRDYILSAAKQDHSTYLKVHCSTPFSWPRLNPINLANNLGRPHRRSQEFVWGEEPEGYKCVLEVGDTVKDKSDSIRFLMLCQSWILGGYCPQCPPPLATPMVGRMACSINSQQQILHRIQPTTSKAFTGTRTADQRLPDDHEAGLISLAVMSYVRPGLVTRRQPSHQSRSQTAQGQRLSSPFIPPFTSLRSPFSFLSIPPISIPFPAVLPRKLKIFGLGRRVQKATLLLFFLLLSVL